MIDKIKSFFMSSNVKTMFDTYVKYFPTVDKKLKLLRGGKIQVTNINSNQIETYNSWEELNNVYKLLPIQNIESSSQIKMNCIDTSNIPGMAEQIICDGPYHHIPIPDKIDLNKYMFGKKIFVRGHKTRYKELQDKFIELTKPKLSINCAMNKEDWVYYIDYCGNFCMSANELVKDLLCGSSEWVEYKLPEPEHFTKEQIAQMIGKDVNSFIID